MRHFGFVLTVLVATALAESPFAQCNLDQQQTSFTSSTGGDRWQSFTAGVTGELCQIDVNCQNASTGNDLEVHYGEGTGALLHREEGISLLAGISTLVLCSPVPVAAGRTYSIRLTATNAWRLQIPGNYAGGRASCCPNDDYWFRTYVRTAAAIPVICDPDQSQTSANSSAGGDRWQSFTAGSTGYLCQVDITCQNASTGNAFEIYRGEGTGGSLLYRQENVALSAGLTAIPVGGRVLMTTGQVYTARFTATNAWSLQIPGSYTGGRASTGANDDYWFRTYVQDRFRDQEVATFTSTAGGDRWQSFTAGTTGELAQVEINCQNASAGNTFQVYQGEGLSGTVIHMQTGLALSAGVSSIPIAARVPVTAGSLYTLRFSSTNAWRLQIPGSYTGGRASCCAADDHWFRTWIRPTCLVLGPGHYCGSFPFVCATDAVIGTSFRVEFQNPQLLGFLLLGFPPVSVPPIPIFPPLTCTRGLVYSLPLFVLATATNPGSITLPVPNDLSIVGLGLVLQGTAIQPGNCLRLTDGAWATLRRP